MWYCVYCESSVVMYNVCKKLNSYCVPYHIDYDTKMIILNTTNNKLLDSINKQVKVIEIDEERANKLIRYTKDKKKNKFCENDIVIATNGKYKNCFGFIVSTLGIEEKGGYKVEFYIMDRIIVDRVPGENLISYTSFD